MEFKEIVSVTGLPGLFKVVATKPNGVVAMNLEDGKTQFVSARIHNISSLENITIYLENDESRELKYVFSDILRIENETPVPDPKNTADGDLRIFFSKAVPLHDKTRVHLSDIKKMIRWYRVLKTHNLLKTEEELKKAEEKTADEKN